MFVEAYYCQINLQQNSHLYYLSSEKSHQSLMKKGQNDSFLIEKMTAIFFNFHTQTHIHIWQGSA